MPGDWEGVETLLSAQQLHARVQELGAEITADYAKLATEETPLLLIGVLKGCFAFYADLVRAIDLRPVLCDFIGVSSYEGGTETSGTVSITSQLKESVTGRHIVIVEDIVDTGLTMTWLLEHFRKQAPRSVEVCTLLEKPERSRVHVSLKYRGFQIPNKFVVGYGLDADGLYRNLPYVGYLNS